MSAHNAAQPTMLPWSHSAISADNFIMGTRSVCNSGLPRFGRPLVCEVKLLVGRDEAAANRQLIVAACNACHSINPQNPFRAALILPRLVRVVRGLAVEAWQYDEESKEGEPVYHVSANTLAMVEELIDHATGRLV